MGRPGPKCTVCQHPQRALIDLAICSQVGRTTIAQRFNIDQWAVWRHGKNHLTPAARAALLMAHKPTAVDLDELKRTEGESLLGQIVAQRARLQMLIEQCHAAGDGGTMVKAEAVINQNLQFSAKLLGQLISVTEHRHSTLLLHPDYLNMRSALMVALRPFPEAAAAVAHALAQIEATSAADMAKAVPERPRRPMIELKAAPEPLWPPPPEPPPKP